MLYDNEDQLEVRHVISLAHYVVDIYAGGERIPEGELWIKRNCTLLEPRFDICNTHTPRHSADPTDGQNGYCGCEGLLPILRQLLGEGRLLPRHAARSRKPERPIYQ
jgi:hypothetical protein